MNVRKQDLTEIYTHLLEARNDGAEFVAFPLADNAISREEIYTFGTHYEAQEFCYEMSTDLDKYEYLAVRSAYRAIGEALHDSSLLIEKNGLIDIYTMVTLRIEKLKNQTVNNQKDNKMNEENFEYLSNQLKYTGFGEGLSDMLREQMEAKNTEFVLAHTPDYGNNNFKATCHFRKSEGSEMFFFNKYEVELQNEDKITQTFYIGKANNFTLKEAFNLLNGRSVYKEMNKLEKIEGGNYPRYEPTDEKYNAWVKLDFKEVDNGGNFKLKYFHDNYGFNLAEAILKLPIEGIEKTETSEQILKSLERGNRHSVVFNKGDGGVKGFVEADPQFKTIKQFDELGKVLKISSSEQKKTEQNVEKKSLKENTQAVHEEKKPTAKNAKKIG